MRVSIWAYAVAVLIWSGCASAQTYTHFGNFEAKLADSDVQTSALGGVALADNGDLYYVTFESTGSALVRVPNAVTAMVAGMTPPRALVFKESGLPDAVAIESGRGYNDVKVDSTGNVYVVATGGTSSTSVLRKIGPAPAHTPQWLFPGDSRPQGVEKIGSDLAVMQFSQMTQYSDATGTSAGLTVYGAMNYQRSIAYNPTNNDIYSGHNGNYDNDSVTVWSGGTPAAFGSYAKVVDNLIPDIGIGTQYGVATQALDFDANNNQLIAVDMADGTGDTAIGVRIYSITGSGAGTAATPAQFITSADAPIVALTGVSYNRVNGNDYIAAAITSAGAYRIALFGISTAAGDWQLLQ